MRHQGFFIALSVVALLTGCAGIPKEAYRLPQSSLELREIQTQSFNVEDGSDILNASVDLLQDMEYNLYTVERQLGILSAGKTVDADSTVEKAGLLAMDVLLVLMALVAGDVPTETASSSAADNFDLYLTMVVLPSLTGDERYTARISVHSTLKDKTGRVREAIVIQEPDIYQEMFNKLSKALYLEEELE
jgi:hypothetical protein